MKFGKKQGVAWCIAVGLTVGMLGSLPADAAETDVTEIAPSTYLEAGEITGTLTVSVGDGRDMRIRIQKKTQEGSDLYYDTQLPENGTYRFQLDNCDYDIQTETETAKYSVTLMDAKDTSCRVTQELVVKDPGFYPGEITASAFVWNVSAAEVASGNSSVETSVDDALVQDGIWSSSGTFVMHYLDYLLGDVSGNEGVGAEDALLALTYYSQKTAGGTTSFQKLGTKRTEEAAFAAADIDRDSEIGADDAYEILRYYSIEAAGGTPSWEE